METTAWQRQDVTQHYLEQVRGGILWRREIKMKTSYQ